MLKNIQLSKWMQKKRDKIQYPLLKETANQEYELLQPVGWRWPILMPYSVVKAEYILSLFLFYCPPKQIATNLVP